MGNEVTSPLGTSSPQHYDHRERAILQYSLNTTVAASACSRKAVLFAVGTAATNSSTLVTAGSFLHRATALRARRCPSCGLSSWLRYTSMAEIMFTGPRSARCGAPQPRVGGWRLSCVSSVLPLPVGSEVIASCGPLSGYSHYFKINPTVSTPSGEVRYAGVLFQAGYPLKFFEFFSARGAPSEPDSPREP